MNSPGPDAGAGGSAGAGGYAGSGGDAGTVSDDVEKACDYYCQHAAGCEFTFDEDGEEMVFTQAGCRTRCADNLANSDGAWTASDVQACAERHVAAGACDDVEFENCMIRAASPIAAWALNYGDTYCEKLNDCCPTVASGTFEGECRGLSAIFSILIEQEVNAGFIAFDDEAGDHCLEEIQAAFARVSCDQPEFDIDDILENSVGCQQTFVPQRGHGESCTVTETDEEGYETVLVSQMACARGLNCAPDDDTWTCQPAVSLGEECAVSEVCVSDAFCGLDADGVARCKPKKADGETCEHSEEC